MFLFISNLPIDERGDQDKIKQGQILHSLYTLFEGVVNWEIEFELQCSFVRYLK